MYSNPQSAFPLPPRPKVESYQKFATDLVKAAGDKEEVRKWAETWIDTLARLYTGALVQNSYHIARKIEEVERAINNQLSSPAGKFRLSDARFIIARAHGFATWTRLIKHIEALADKNSSVARFEAAADAIVAGELSRVKRFLKQDPSLVRRRSTRQHGATLLHYTAANGVEGYRQRTPQNIVEITTLLLDSGAEVDAEADVYGGGSTTLGLAATSVHPFKAGVQNPLLQLLIDRGAEIDRPRSGGHESTAVRGCLDNGRGDAAVYLAEHGARLDLESAAGVGRLDVVASAFTESGKLRRGIKKSTVESALRYACCWGRINVIEYLLDHGVNIGSPDTEGQTPLHWAAIFGQLETVKYLLKRKPPLESKNVYGGTVLGQTLWSAGHGGNVKVFSKIIEVLIAAGAKVPERHVPVNKEIDKLLTKYGSKPEPSWYWFGEKPRS
ncbi:MAG TPA: ankyrin repeat domain-containing protein [Pyrinomonadaceae bacterium]